MSTEIIKNLLKNRYVKLALILFIAGFFLGYTIRILDFTQRTFFDDTGVIYPIHQEQLKGYEMPQEESEVDLLYVMRTNIISVILLVAIGAVFAFPTIVYLFLIGLSAGTSIPEVLEFAGILMAIKVLICFASYAITVILAGSIGIEIGKMLWQFIKEKKIKIQKDMYDRALYALILIVINIILQYVLLVVL